MSEKTYINTTIKRTLIRELKKLAADKDTKLNVVLEEAIIDLLKKYKRVINDDS